MKGEAFLQRAGIVQGAMELQAEDTVETLPGAAGPRKECAGSLGCVQNLLFLR